MSKRNLSQILSGIQGPQGFQGISGAGQFGPTGDQGVQGPTGQDGQSSIIEITTGTTPCNYMALFPQNNNTSLILEPQGNGFISAQIPDGQITGGDCRGDLAVDFQMARTSSNQVASGTSSMILGGKSNRCTGTDSTVVGGKSNTNLGTRSVILGGVNNQIQTVCNNGMVFGQNHNLYSGDNSAIIGGYNGYIDGDNSVIIGGKNNIISHNNCVIIGGYNSVTTTGNNQVWIADTLYLETVVNFTFSPQIVVWDVPGFTKRVMIQNQSNFTPSDLRLKENIEQLPDSFFDLDTLHQIKLIKYRKKNNLEKVKYGFSAQNLQTHIPHLITEEDYLLIDRLSLIQYLAGLLKNQNQRITNLKSRVNALLDQKKPQPYLTQSQPNPTQS